MLVVLISYILVRFVLPKAAPDEAMLQGENSATEGAKLSREKKIHQRVLKLAAKLNIIIARIWQVVAGIAILPIISAVVSIIVCIVGIATSTPNALVSFRFDEVGSLMDMANITSPSFVIFMLVTALIPLLYFTYLAIMLLFVKMVRWRVLIASMLVWILVVMSGAYIHRDTIDEIRQNKHLIEDISDID